MGKAKKSKNNPDIRNQAKPQLGKKARFIKLYDAVLACHACKKPFSNQMVSEYNRQYYCNEECIRSEVDS